jgi:hypothetical protein
MYVPHGLPLRDRKPRLAASDRHPCVILALSSLFDYPELELGAASLLCNWAA